MKDYTCVCCCEGNNFERCAVKAETVAALPEPWRTYAMMLDAATNEASSILSNFVVAAIPDICRKSMYPITGVAVYTFTRDFWISHGGEP